MLFLTLGLAAGLVLALGAEVATRLWHATNSRPIPSFPSLSDRPDSSLHGTVAYLSAANSCIRIIAASGASSRDVLCLSKNDLAVRPAEGLKPAGPQLVWLPDGRLEVTMFWSRPASGPPSYLAGWQKLIDVRSGVVVENPTPPAIPAAVGGPTLSPDGQRVEYTFDAASGRVAVTLVGSAGARTLLAARGPGEYTYRFGPVYWAPSWQWIVARDQDRILVITAGNPSQTRVLVSGLGLAGGGEAGPDFAVTATDWLTPTG